MSGPNLTTRQILILTAAAVADFVWICLPGYIVSIAGGFVGPTDGALGKQWGLFLLLALTLAVTMLWAPTAEKISHPLIHKLAKRIGVTRDKEE